MATLKIEFSIGSLAEAVTVAALIDLELDPAAEN